MALFAAGEVLTASALNELIQPGWTTYVPTWSALAGTPPSGIGNGVLTSRYRRVADVADEIEWEGWLIGGSTTGWGTAATWNMSVPVTAHADSVSGAVGPAHYLNSGTSEHSGIVRFAANTVIRFIHDGAGSVGTTSPFTWGTADEMRWSLRYRPAT